MPPFDGIRQRVHARNDARRAAFAVEFTLIRPASEGGGVNFTCNPRTLAQDDFPMLEVEGRGNNAHELNPLVLDRLPLHCDIQAGDYVIYPSTGDAKKDRFKVEGVQDVIALGTAFRRQALIFVAPKVQ